MADFDELRFLLDELEEAAEHGQGAKLSLGMTHLLMSAIEAQRSPHAGSHAKSPAHRFKIILGNDDGEGPATILGATSDIGVARSILAAAATRNPRRKIRLFDGTVVVDSAN